MGRLDLQFDWPFLIGATVLALACAYCSYRHCRHAQAGWRVYLPEALRLLAAAAIVFTMMRPEFVTEIDLEQQPEVVVLMDHTGSMQTADVVAPDGPPTSRRDWLEAKAQTEFWGPLAERYRVAVETFGGPPPVEPGAEPAAASDGTDLNAALAGLLPKYHHLRAVLLLSDGDWNMGEAPVAAATQMRLNQTRVYPIAVGSNDYLPDIELVDLKAPAFCLVGEHVAIPFSIRSRLRRDVRLRVKLTASGVPQVDKEVALPAGKQIQESILWKAGEVGEYQFTFEVPVQKDETNAANNRASFRLAVRQEILKVLVVESLPRWEYRYLRNALSRDPGVEVSCLLLHPGMKRGDGVDYIQSFPDTREKLAGYDVIFLGDVGLGEGELSEEELGLIRGLVEQQGSGLVFLPGRRGRIYSLLPTVIGDMLPVLLEEGKTAGLGFPRESRLALTTVGQGHLLTMLAESPAGNRLLWGNLPGFYWHTAVKKARPGSQVLAVHASLRNRWGRLPLLATRDFGNGHTLFMGADSAWRWRKGVEDTYHYRFWGQVVRWMAHRRHLAQRQGIRVFFSPENPKQGDTVYLQATVLDQKGFPLADGEATVDISGGGQAERLTMTPVEGGWGVFKASFVPAHGGEYSINVDCPAAKRQLEARLTVRQTRREKVGQPARFGALRDIARISDGQFGGTADLEETVRQISLLPTQEQLQLRYALWCQWWWGLVIVGLCGLCWALRKIAGLV